MSPTTFACLCAPEMGEYSYSEENGTVILSSTVLQAALLFGRFTINQHLQFYPIYWDHLIEAIYSSLSTREERTITRKSTQFSVINEEAS